MYEYSKKLFEKIKNKENLQPNELMTIERCLRLYDVSESLLNFQVGLDKENPYELTERVETMGCRRKLI